VLYLVDRQPIQCAAMKTAVWDQHACLPLEADGDVRLLLRYQQSAGAYVCVNVGYTPHSTADTIALIKGYSQSIWQTDGIEIATTPRSIDDAVRRGQIAVGFDLEDSASLDGNLETVRLLAESGVTSMIPTYNYANRAGSGSLDVTDAGLTAWGRDLIAELNSNNVIVDGSHCGDQTSLDICRATTKPMMYSHSCLRTVWDHPRNITDDQARACAETGGVIGITGVGIFLGPNTATAEAMVRHIEATVDLVGVEHVGLSTDESFDPSDFIAELTANPQLFDASYTRWGPITWIPPEEFLTVPELLEQRGWSSNDVTAIAFGNFRRLREA